MKAIVIPRATSRDTSLEALVDGDAVLMEDACVTAALAAYGTAEGGYSPS